VLLVAVVVGVGGGPTLAAPVDLPPTFTTSTLRARAGQVIDVSGTNCTLNGRAMESAGVRVNRKGENGFDGSYYDVRPDGSWSGFYVVPQEARPGAHSINSDCGADDMVVAGPTYDFEVLGGAPAAIAVETPPGGPATVSGSGCLDDGRPLPQAAVMVEPERSGQFTFIRRPLPEPSARPKVAANGSFRAEVRLPGPGRWEVFARCWSDSLTLETAAHRVEISGSGPKAAGGAAAAPVAPKPGSGSARPSAASEAAGAAAAAESAEAVTSRERESGAAAPASPGTRPRRVPGRHWLFPLAPAAALAFVAVAVGWRRRLAGRVAGTSRPHVKRT
jgi:hypothetical protein